MDPTVPAASNSAEESAENWHWTDMWIERVAQESAAEGLYEDNDPTPQHEGIYHSGIRYGYEQACAEILKEAFTHDEVSEALATTMRAHGRSSQFGLMDVIAYLLHKDA